MITNEGKHHIKRYLAGHVPAIARSIAFGVGTRAEALTDTALQLESGRAAVSVTSYDFTNNRLIFKAPVPDAYAGSVYEVGLFSMETNPASGAYGSRTLSDFDSVSEGWVNTGDGLTPAWSTTGQRIGTNGLLHTPAANGSSSTSLRNISLDLSGNSGSDTFAFAFNVTGTNASSVQFLFMKDASNYYSFSAGTAQGVNTAGYKIVEFTKGAATVTGQPDWSQINEIRVTTNSSAAGASNVLFDSIRIEDRDAPVSDYVLVARKVLAQPMAKVAGQNLDIEFTLDVTV